MKRIIFLLPILFLASCFHGEIMNRNNINYYWIQKTDYSAEEFQVNSKEQTITDFLDFDWKNEIGKYNENDDTLNCPVGFGLHDGLKDGSSFTTLLHICPI